MTIIYHFLILLSGVSALAYQVVWIRILAQVFGVSAYALTSVLATYLGGLALGAFILGRSIDRSSKPLRFFGFLEIGTAIASLLGIWLLSMLDPIHIFFANRLSPDSSLLVCVRVILTSFAVLPSTFLMGGTLPAMVRVCVADIRMVGSRLSMLYAVNTLGALIGSLAAGFFIIRMFGLNLTFWSAAALNSLVGITALILTLKTKSPAHAVSNIDTTPFSGKATQTFTSGPGLLIAVGLSGFAALGMEVLWTRLLVLVMGGSIYAYVTVVSSFLLGIVLGGLLARFMVDRLNNLRLTFGWIQILIAFTSMATLPVFWNIGTGMAQDWLADMGSNGWLATIAGRFGISLLIMLIPTTLLGMIFPIAGKMRSSHIHWLGGQIGEVYASNSLGNVAGTFVTGFLFLPLLGIQKGFATLAIVSLIAAAWGLKPSQILRDRGRFKYWLSAAPLVITICCILSGIFVLIQWNARPIAVDQYWESKDIIYYREGPVAKVEVFQDNYDPRQRFMVVDGTIIGETFYGVDEKQRALAHFPFLLQSKRTPQNILTIGLGTGILAGELVRYPDVINVDCLELSPAVIEACRMFDDVTGDVLSNKKINLINDDGANFLRRSRIQYDTIISDGKSRPGHAGNSLFYSADYYALCRDHLASDGLMIQWVPLETPPEHLKTILRTFSSIFPHAYFWINPPYSTYLVGTLQSLVIDTDHVNNLLLDPVTEGLSKYGWKNGCDITSLLVADRPMLIEWLSSDKIINTLEHPILEFYPSGTFESASEDRIAENLESVCRILSEELSDIVFQGMDGPEASACNSAADLLIKAFSLIEQPDYGSVTQGLALLEEAFHIAPQHSILKYAAAGIHIDMGHSSQTSNNAQRAIKHYEKALQFRPDDTIARLNLGILLNQTGYPEAAVIHFLEVLKYEPDNTGVRLDLGFLLGSLNRIPEAKDQFQMIIKDDPNIAEAYLGMGYALKAEEQDDLAHSQFLRAVELEPRIADELAGQGIIL
ncbi:MAG: fused MFS/spermidine synthase [Deltaproteobacteria bacterium]|nr:fused MFS/spermidine synthase [Deltaproteobacteria bacterium]